jgi:signal transduction histidine kinase
MLPQMIWRQPIIAPGFSFLFFAFIPLGMGYAVVTQRLLDIDVVIRRGVIYGLITIIMATILSAAIFFTIAFQESLETPQEIIIALLLGGVATALFGPIKRGVEILVDKLFYKDRYDYRQTISNLSTSLNLLSDFNEISRVVVGTAVRTLNLAGGCLLVQSEFDPYEVRTAQGSFMDTDKQTQIINLVSWRSSEHEFPNSASTIDPDMSFIIPLAAGEEEVGILCLSQKVTKQTFSLDDIYLIQGLASVSSGALHGASLVRDVSIRNTFVTIASHELRTPLTSVMGYAELLLRRDPPEETRLRWIKYIYDSSIKIKDITDDLLNVSRIQSSKVGIKLDAVKLPDVIEETLTIVRESTDKHEFIINIEPDLPKILIDRDKFNQVIGNLVSNAAKYSPKGGRVTLSAYSNPETNSVIISVTDEGIGIDHNDKESLFKTFHRIQRPETMGIRGSGLGLFIVKEWTERMGGKVWLESELNKGSTFFVSFQMDNSSPTT